MAPRSNLEMIRQKMIAIMVLTSFIATQIASQEITTTTCGTSKGCVKQPSSCTSSSNCDFLLTYRRRPSDSNIMEFEISSIRANGWIALGFNPAQSMADTRGEICYNGMIRGFHARGYFTPSFVAPATNTVLTGISAVNGALICRFSRHVAPSSYQAALGPAMHPIFAVGEISSGFVVRHSHRSSGPQMDFLAFTAVVPTTTAMQPTTAATTTEAATTTAKPTTSTTQGMTTTMEKTASTSTTVTTATKATTATTGNMVTTSTMATTAETANTATTTRAMNSTMKTSSTTNMAMSKTITSTRISSNNTTLMTKMNLTNVITTAKTNTTMPLTIDISSCGKSKDCFRIPNGCTTSESCKFLITWKPDATKQRVQIEMKGNGNKWVAFGLNNAAGQMPGTYGEVCYVSGAGTALKGFHAKIRGTPDFTSTTPDGVTLEQISKTSGAISCRYSRPFSATGSLGIGLNRDLYIVVAAGDSMTGGTPGYHLDKRYFSVAKFNIANAKFGRGMATRNAFSAVVLAFFGAVCMTIVNFLW